MIGIFVILDHGSHLTYIEGLYLGSSVGVHYCHVAALGLFLTWGIISNPWSDLGDFEPFHNTSPLHGSEHVRGHIVASGSIESALKVSSLYLRRISTQEAHVSLITGVMSCITL